jgi:hypothetical protein
LAKRELRSSKAAFRKTARSVLEGKTARLSGVVATEKNIARNCIGSSCFVAGVHVLTERGWERIENIKPGDSVFSRNPATGSLGYRRVTAAFRTFNTAMVRMTVGASRDIAVTETVTGTIDHPFWSATRRRWVGMGELQAGEAVLTESNSSATVVRVERRSFPEATATYNFTVDAWQTYFVAGSEQAPGFGIWVHNTQQRGCRLKWQQLLAEFNPETDIPKLRTDPKFSGLRPHQKYQLGCRNPITPDPSKIAPDGVFPRDFDPRIKPWEGTVYIKLKSSQVSVPYRNGWPDFSDFVGKDLREALKPRTVQD